MFIQYFGMKYNPFSKEIDSSHLYTSEESQEVAARLKYLEQTRRIGLIVGEPGVGKTTSLRKYVDHLNPSLFKPCYFALSTVTVKEFYRGLALLLGEEPKFQKIGLFNQIQAAIGNLHNQNRITPVIVLDEIHLASNALLEDLRLLFNFSMDSDNPYILILSGQPLIRNKLALTINNPLRQRITVKYNLQGLKETEMEAYCNTRLEMVGCKEKLFTEEALRALYSITKGHPRLVNNIATAALLYGYSQKTRIIDEEAIYQAQNEVNF
ncbi:ExeA family protein [Alkaliphilus hydrothermalis]|uniref:Type II secretory pathway predicted ATPase ExeA n=1 Tax=Alkaliphilus hydrothermalis TaxID=1482730 RepID=A0ABS2NT91_9FIRM|nr:AAA family ATPase [Alkaliphilus hydrothermalis]MBM7616189.1 type II secretory pathway predicted ATPase ExeA [Alkaliphilus hydrothermalis]